MGYNILSNPPDSPVKDIGSWTDKYNEAQIEMLHDQSMLTLGTPDDSILVVGPPRLRMATSSTGSTGFYVVGMVNSFNYNESSQVQPLKAIGSKRHIFSKSNAPVSGSIGRMVILGSNLYRALYAMMKTGDITGRLASSDKQQFSLTSIPTQGNWYTNLEEDLFRYPIGLGIIYKSPAVYSDGGSKLNVVGADYIEQCVIVNRAIGMQSGSAMIMEQVSFMADRVIPWKGYTPSKFDQNNPAESVAK